MTVSQVSPQGQYFGTVFYRKDDGTLATRQVFFIITNENNEPVTPYGISSETTKKCQTLFQQVIENASLPGLQELNAVSDDGIIYNQTKTQSHTHQTLAPWNAFKRALLDTQPQGDHLTGTVSIPVPSPSSPRSRASSINSQSSLSEASHSRASSADSQSSARGTSRLRSLSTTSYASAISEPQAVDTQRRFEELKQRRRNIVSNLPELPRPPLPEGMAGVVKPIL